MIKIILLLILTLTSAYGQFSWKRNVTPYGGDVNVLFAKDDTLLAAQENTIFYSTNGGLEWIRTNASTSKSFRSFASVNKIFYAASEDGLYRSTALKSWSKVKSGTYSAILTDSDGSLYALNYGVIIKSTNEGYTWSNYSICPFSNPEDLYVTKDYLIVTGWGELYRKEINNNNPWELLQFPGMYNSMYLSVDSTGKIFGVSSESRRFISSFDNGATWSSKDLSTLFPRMNPYGIFSFDNTVLIISSIWGDTARIPVYISENNGETWRSFNYGLPERTSIHCFARSGDYLFAGIDAFAVMRGSLLLNKEWATLNKGINELSISGIALIDNSTFLISTYGRGVLKSTDYGVSWKESIGAKGYYMGKFLQSKDGDVYVGTETDVYRSIDQGNSWIRLFSPGDNNYRRKLFEADSGIYYLSGGSIYKTSDKGHSWTTVFPSYTINFSCLAMTYEGKAFAGNNESIYRSTNYGFTWVKVYPGIYGEGIIDVMIDPLGYIYALGIKGMVKSTDGGNTWKAVNTGMTNKYLTRMFSKTNGELFCYAQYQNNTPAELYYSTDHGNNWNKVTGVLSNLYVSDIAFREEEIFIATNRGLFINDNTTSLSEGNNQVSGFVLSQNYPNPFNPNTKINYYIPKEGEVELFVYDVLGKKVKELVNEYKAAGRYEVEFDASGLSSGIYFYKIRAGEYTAARKMILLR